LKDTAGIRKTIARQKATAIGRMTFSLLLTVLMPHRVTSRGVKFYS
jgi:hypothetical protein